MPTLAAMNFSRHARQVTMLVRGASLADTLSRYLIDRIERTPNIEVRYGSSVAALHGDGWLDAIELRSADGTRERVPATKLTGNAVPPATFRPMLVGKVR